MEDLAYVKQEQLSPKNCLAEMQHDFWGNKNAALSITWSEISME